MKGYGIKRIGGKGYENRNVIRRREKRSDRVFFFFLLLFGASVYWVATAFFRAFTFPVAWVSAILPL